MSIILQPHVIMHIYSFSVKMALLLLSEATCSSSNRLRHIKLRSLPHHQQLPIVLANSFKMAAVWHCVACSITTFSKVWHLSIYHQLHLHLLILILQILKHLIINSIYLGSISTKSWLHWIGVQILKICKLDIVFEQHIELIVITLTVRIALLRLVLRLKV